MWNPTTFLSALAALCSSLPCIVHASQFHSRAYERGLSTAPNMTTETAQFFPQHHSQRVKIRYGPFTVPSMDVNNGMKDFTQAMVQKPCSDCLLTWMQAGLEYPNGSIANANTSLWLHHTVFSNLDRTAVICSEAGSGDPFFASGNERTPMDICVNGTDQAGYYIGPKDNLGLLAELMNMDEVDQEAFVTMTYEYIPTVPSGFDQVKALWFDIGGCGDSDMPAKADQAFQYSSPPWTSNITGRITFLGGHLHDGGTHLTLEKKNTTVCDCEAAYGQNSAYIDPGAMGMSSSMSGMKQARAPMSSMSGMTVATTSTMEMSTGTTTSMAMSTSSGTSMVSDLDTIHISSISTCANMATVAIGDEWWITAYYNSTEHALMTNTDGSLAPIMGISIAYVADTNMTSTATGPSGSNGSTGAGVAATSDGIVVHGFSAGVLGALMLGVVIAALSAIL